MNYFNLKIGPEKSRQRLESYLIRQNSTQNCFPLLEASITRLDFSHNSSAQTRSRTQSAAMNMREENFGEFQRTLASL